MVDLDTKMKEAKKGERGGPYLVRDEITVIADEIARAMDFGV